MKLFNKKSADISNQTSDQKLDQVSGKAEDKSPALCESEDDFQTRPISALEAREEVKRLLQRRKYRRTLQSTIFTLVTVAAIAILVATLWMPVLEVYGTSMSPTLNEGDIVVTTKSHNYNQGDVIAFYYNNKVLVKRVIAGPGDTVDMTEDGKVLVNGEYLDEPYVSDLAYGDTNISLPYEVEESHWFVMGDHRSISMDSRNSAVGTVAEEQIVGKLTYVIWPWSSI